MGSQIHVFVIVAVPRVILLQQHVCCAVCCCCLRHLPFSCRSQAITDPDESSSAESGTESGSGSKLPTGRVIGILARSGRDFVASFSTEDEGAGVKKAGE